MIYSMLIVQYLRPMQHQSHRLLEQNTSRILDQNTFRIPWVLKQGYQVFKKISDTVLNVYYNK